MLCWLLSIVDVRVDVCCLLKLVVCGLLLLFAVCCLWFVACWLLFARCALSVDVRCALFAVCCVLRSTGSL